MKDAIGRLGAAVIRDAGTLFRGAVTSVVAAVALIPLTVLALLLMPVGVGLTLIQAVFDLTEVFARTSRARALGEPVGMRPRSTGSPEWARAALGDGNRWQDLVCEALIAPVVRVGGLVVALVWTGLALGGLTYPIWGIGAFVNGRMGLAESAGQIAFNVAVGVVSAVTLPLALRLLVRFDALTTASALGWAPPPAPPSGAMPPRPAASPSAPERSSRRLLRPRTWSTQDWWWAAALALAVIMVAIGWPLMTLRYSVPVVWAMLFTFVHAAALPVAVRWPVASNALTIVALVSTMSATAGVGGLPWPFTVPSMIVQFAIIVIVFARTSWGLALPSLVLPAFIGVGAEILTDDGPGGVANLVVYSSIGVGLAVMGGIWRQLRTSRRALAHERAVGQEQSARRRELEERNRIARELHDVVAHSMSVISVQASTARYRLPEVDDRSAGEFETIAGSARQALGEMRALLSLLRADDEAPLLPQPTLADVPELVEASRRSGATIDLDFGDVGVPPATGTTAYRVVQEALSNALRHAPGSDLSVSVRGAAEELCIDVVNGASSPAATVALAPGSGMGLPGIRERVLALGGSLVTGPEGEGFGVHARLPLL